MSKLLYSIAIFSLLLASCSGEQKKEDNKEKEDIVEPGEQIQSAEPLEFKERIDEYVFGLDTSLTGYNKMSTLPFSNVKEEIELRSNFYANANEELKMIEEYENRKAYQRINRYYFDGEKMVYSNSIYIDYNNDKNYNEKKYYFENGMLKAAFEVKEFQSEPVAISTEGVSIDANNAMQMLNLKGDFEITFSGFIEQPAGAFIIVNAAKKGFNSALLVDQGGEDEFVKDLYNNKKKYKGKKIKVKWVSVVDPGNGLRQNAYRGGEWVD